MEAEILQRLADEGINYSIIFNKGVFMVDIFDNEGKLLITRGSLPTFKHAIKRLSDEAKKYLEKQNGK